MQMLQTALAITRGPPALCLPSVQDACEPGLLPDNYSAFGKREPHHRPAVPSAVGKHHPAQQRPTEHMFTAGR